MGLDLGASKEPIGSSRLALGTAQFGLRYGIANRRGQVPFHEVQQIIREARAGGMDTLDTAIAYGESEETLGRVGVADWRVISKLPPIPAGCENVASWVTDSVHRSLKKLGVPRLDALLLHRPEDCLRPVGDAVYAALQRLKDEGLAEKIGISVYGPDELDALAGRYAFDVVQAPFNVFDRRLATSGWLARLKEEGCEVHVRSVFLQGLLLMRADSRPSRFDRWRSLFGRWEDWLSRAGTTAVRACIAFALSHRDVDRVVVGVDAMAQLRELLSAELEESSELPPDFHVSDPDLINPSRWSSH